MDKVAVLIPCYNESKTIAKVIKDFKEVLPEDSVIYVYDNNSSDGTADIAREAGAVVRHEYQQGKGNVIRRMFREIDAECYLMVDGDDTYPAEFAPEMISKVLDRKVDMVVGDRLSSTYFEENKRPFHNLGNSMVRAFINTLFKSNIKDIMTGYRAFSFQFVKSFPVLSKGFEIETEMSIHAIDKNMSMENVIIEYRDRPEGSESKLNTYSDGFKVLRTIARLFRTYKPMAYFGIWAFILLGLAIGFFIPVLITFIKTGLVPNYPTLIVCGFAAIAGILSFFAGLILETMVHKNKQDFELRLLQIENDRKKLMEDRGHHG
ncbi:MAG: glycosyltransferase [Clostridiales bacterium]|nr:glycosyltransferase [Clostridiales bacterium]